MKIRIISLFLVLMMVLSLIPVAGTAQAVETRDIASKPETVNESHSIWVGGVQMNDGEYLASGADHTTRSQPQSGYAHFANGVLVLDNYEYEGPGYTVENLANVVFGAAVYSVEPLNVVLKGHNVLNQTVVNYSIFCEGDLYIEGKGSLHVTQEIASQRGDIWIAGGTITVSDIDIHISADNGSVIVTGGSVNARIHGCYDIEIAGGFVNAESKYAALDAGRDITIYGGSVIAKTVDFWDDGYYCAIEYGQYFTVVPSLVIRASTEPNGVLVPYVAGDHGLYDLFIIEEPTFTMQPESGAVPEGHCLTVRWQTNFEPIRVEIYYLHNGIEVLDQTLPGDATSAEVIVRDEEYYVVAYLNDSVYAESERFKAEYGEAATVYFCVGGSPVISQNVVIGQYAEEPEPPYAESMEFLGWYTADGEYYYFDQPVTEDLYLYAKFGHYVIFCFGEDPISGQGVEHGHCAIEPEEPAWEDMIFLGWYTKPEGGEKFDFSTPITGTIYLYARFVDENPFTDVPAGSFYEESVRWALENGITTGATATTFNPNGSCLRAQVVTFLHRAAGSPEPNSQVSPFTDVKPRDFFFKPVLWAVDNGITNGTSATTFGSMSNCNRAAVVTFLWRAAGCPQPNSHESPFVDVKPTDFYYKAVLWAVDNGITNGINATHFGPTRSCNRAQVVTFLYRAYN